jgi:hypothetical protein
MYVEIKYLNLLSTQLSKFKQKKPYLWNFRCPYCGDSQRNKNKARGFVFQLKGKLLYKCHNCQISVPVEKLIQDVNPELYKEYRMEKFTSPKKQDMRKFNKRVSTFGERMNDFHFEVLKRDILHDLTSLDNLNNSHPAKEYILNRKLPTEALYYTEKFMEWTNSVKPDTFQEITQDEGRIIIPFKDKEGNVFGFQGRSLSSSGLRYITVLLEEGQPKIFGLNSINYDKTIYITEGPFDSLLLQNAIAMAGADASVSSLGNSDIVFVYDNEPRNVQITTRILKHISDGESVVIWPSSIKEKDINDMHLAGHDVQEIVSSCTYTGLTATLKFNDWRK